MSFAGDRHRVCMQWACCGSGRLSQSLGWRRRQSQGKEGMWNSASRLPIWCGAVTCLCKKSRDHFRSNSEIFPPPGSKSQTQSGSWVSQLFPFSLFVLQTWSSRSLIGLGTRFHILIYIGEVFVMLVKFLRFFCFFDLGLQQPFVGFPSFY